jgi:hypothetical protein
MADPCQVPLENRRLVACHMSIKLTDEKRLEAYSTEKKDKRELVVWIWYPVIPISDSKPAIYLPDKWSEADFVYGMKLGTTNFGCHSFENAPVDSSNSTYPIIIFSQAGFSVLSYSAIIEEIASHGYIVVGINHTYDAPVTVLSDGRVIPLVLNIWKGSISEQAQSENLLDLEQLWRITSRQMSSLSLTNWR